MNIADELLHGAFDMHCHAYPEFSLEFPNRYKTADHLKLMQEAGMGGVVLKSHFWPTVGIVDQIREQFSDMEIVSSITLNECTGGLNLWAVEAAAKQNAKVIWLPTWSAQNDIDKKGISKTIANYIPTLSIANNKGGYKMIDENGDVIPIIYELFALCRDYDLLVCTGHISPKESIVLAGIANDIGLKKFILSHPDSGSVGATNEQIGEMVNLGMYIEICALGITPIHYRITPQRLKEIITIAGPDRCVLSTDYFFEWASPAPEQMRLLISTLLHAGVTPYDINTMAKNVPRYLLNLEM